MEFISLIIASLIHYIFNTIYFEDHHKFKSSTILIFLCVCLFLKDIQFIQHYYRCSKLLCIFLESIIGTVVLELFMVIFWTQAEIILYSISQRFLMAGTDHLINFLVFVITSVFFVHIMMITTCLENTIYFLQRQTEN